jgi:polyhydroxyalkanoate synthesis regulator phasin
MAKRKPSYGFLTDRVSELYTHEDQRIQALEIQKSHLSREAFTEQLEELVEAGHLTQAEVDAFIQPLKGLDYEKAMMITQLQNQASQLWHKQPLQFSVVPVPKSTSRRALEWTALQISLLHLPGLDFEPVSLPYRQCHWCGSVLHPRGGYFEGKQKFCHAKDCTETGNSNPQAHPGCCAGAWGLVKRSLRESMSYYERQKLSSAQRQERQAKLMARFFKERLSANRKMFWDVTPQERYWMEVLHQRYQVKKLGDLLRLEGDPEAQEIVRRAYPFHRWMDELTRPVRAIEEMLAPAKAIQEYSTYIQRISKRLREQARDLNND